MNPLSSRLQVLFDKDGEERINFKSFVSALAIFAERARPDMRTRGEAQFGWVGFLALVLLVRQLIGPFLLRCVLQLCFDCTISTVMA